MLRYTNIFTFFLVMSIQRLWSQAIALVLVLVIGLSGCSASATPGGLVGNYQQDSVTLITSLRTALEGTEDSPEKAAAQLIAKQNINDFASRYRTDPSLTKRSSYTTMRTALNSLAAHYAAYPNRPVPEKLKENLTAKFKQIESALERGA
jgi:photosystem II Psb27 protein